MSERFYRQVINADHLDAAIDRNRAPLSATPMNVGSNVEFPRGAVAGLEQHADVIAQIQLSQVGAGDSTSCRHLDDAGASADVERQAFDTLATVEKWRGASTCVPACALMCSVDTFELSPFAGV